jgi:hypothetical protein
VTLGRAFLTAPRARATSTTGAVGSAPFLGRHFHRGGDNKPERACIAHYGLAPFGRAYPIKQVFRGGMALRVGDVQGARELRFQDFRQAFDHAAAGLGGKFAPGKLSLWRGLAVLRE